MCDTYDKWPELASEFYSMNYEPINFKEISHIVFAGMGGSGTLGDVFSSILSKTGIHVSTLKGYLLPNTVNRNTLVVATSISGNTVETLSCLTSAVKKTKNVIAFSSGGRIEEYSRENRIEYRKIPEFHSPRASFPCFLYGMLKVLGPVLPINKSDIIESIDNMKEMRSEITFNNLSEGNSSLALANWINGMTLIYYPFGLQAAAIRFKNSLQENAKTHVITEDVIEACHNGIVAWEKQANIQPILIRGDEDYIKTKERWEILKEYFYLHKIDFKEINSIKGSILSKLVNLIYELDYASIYLAIKNKVDPAPIESIDFIKSRL